MGEQTTQTFPFYNIRYKVVRDALYNALASGSTCIGAMGELDGNVAFVPARFSEWGLITAVGASDLCGVRVADNPNGTARLMFSGEGSPYGSWLDVLAPGYQLQVATPTDGASAGFCDESYFSVERFGTSFSSAIVSGMAGALIGLQPGLHDTDVQQIVRRTAEEQFALPEYRGAGRVNYFKAVQMIAPEPPSAPTLFTGSVAVVSTDSLASPLQLTVRSTDGLIADGTYTVERHALTFRKKIEVACVEPPSFWPHVVGTRGWLAADPDPHYFNYNAAQLIGQDSDSLTFRTYVYKVIATGKWLPCPPESARVAFHGVGRPVGLTDAESSIGSAVALGLVGSPLRPGGRIDCSVSGAQGRYVRFQVYTVAGRLVAGTLRPVAPEGRARWSWDGLGRNGARLPPAVYLVRAEGEDGTRLGTAKVVIVQ